MRPLIEVLADYHTHTRHSHGRGTVMDNARAARDRGLAEVAITDHGPAHLGIGMEPGELGQVVREVDRANEQGLGVRVLAGVEANVVSLGGMLDVRPAEMERLDLVLAGLHLGVWPPRFRDRVGLFWNNSLFRHLGRKLRDKARLLNTKALVEAVWRNPIDIVTHPGLFLPIDPAEVARACARRGTAMEINSAHGYLTVEYVREAARHGVDFAINSDAHSPERVGDVARAVAVAEAAGLPPERVVNARQPQKEPGLEGRIQAVRPRRWEPGGAGERRTWPERQRGEETPALEAGEPGPPGAAGMRPGRAAGGRRPRGTGSGS